MKKVAVSFVDFTRKVAACYACDKAICARLPYVRPRSLVRTFMRYDAKVIFDLFLEFGLCTDGYFIVIEGDDNSGALSIEGETIE